MAGRRPIGMRGKRKEERKKTFVPTREPTSGERVIPLQDFAEIPDIVNAWRAGTQSQMDLAKRASYETGAPQIKCLDFLKAAIGPHGVPSKEPVKKVVFREKPKEEPRQRETAQTSGREQWTKHVLDLGRDRKPYSTGGQLAKDSRKKFFDYKPEKPRLKPPEKSENFNRKTDRETWGGKDPFEGVDWEKVAEDVKRDPYYSSRAAGIERRMRPGHPEWGLQHSLTLNWLHGSLPRVVIIETARQAIGCSSEDAIHFFVDNPQLGQYGLFRKEYERKMRRRARGSRGHDPDSGSRDPYQHLI